MNRRLWIGGGLLVLLMLVCGTSVWVAQSRWLRTKILGSIIEQTEKASGGRVEIGSFDLDWHTLTAQLNRFVVRGTEPKGQAPLLSVDSIKVRVRIISLLRRDISIQAIEANTPRVHVIVAPDGSTNVPRPKIATKGSLPERILDLRIARFDLRNGMFAVDSSGHPTHWFPWNAKGENLNAQIEYEMTRARYSGDVALGSLQVLSTNVQVSGKIALERNRVLVSDAVVNTKESAIHFSGVEIRDFRTPVATGRYQARISLADTGLKATGSVALDGSARFASMADYSISGGMQVKDLSVNQLRHVQMDGHLDAGPGKYLLSAVRMNIFGGRVTGAAESPDLQSFHATAQTAHLDLRQLAALITRQSLPYNAELSGPVELNGRLGHMNADAHLALSPSGSSAPVKGDVSVSYNAAAGTANLGESWIELPKSRLSASGTLGAYLRVKLQSTDFKELLPAADILTGGKTPAIGFGHAVFDGTVNGPLANPQIAGHLAVQDGSYGEYKVSALSGDVAASRSNAGINRGDVVYGDIHARGTASLQLTNWIATDASAVAATIEVPSADVGKWLAMSGHKEVQITGTLNTSARITGTLKDPLADAEIALTGGTIYQQPFDSITGKLQVINRTAQSLTGVFASGSKRVNITAQFEHAGTQFPAGTLDFNLTSNTMPLNQIALVRERQPDIRGFGRFHADGAVKIGHDAKHELQFGLTALNADASANSIELGGRNLGDAHFTAQTKGDLLTAHFESNAANAAIRGDGTMQLDGLYPVNGKVTFSDASLNSLVALAVKADDAAGLNFDGTAAGELTFSGPAKTPDLITASVNIPKIELRAQSLPNFVVTNNGPVRATLKNSVVRIESAHFKAPQTDITLEGTVSPKLAAPLNLHLDGSINLALARTINPEVVSTGVLSINTNVRGAWTAPDITGRASMRNADFHYSDFANGLTGANGEFVFSGTHATIESFTAESGGGKVQVTGFGAYTKGLLSFRVEAQAHQIRVRYPEGISSVSDAALTFAGTSQRSETSGVITVHRVSINPKSDAATILANAVGPAQTPAAKNSLASNMNLDVQVSTAPDVALQTSVTQSLQADANLRLRGTATNPALIGRINITQGEMVFFGNKYSINTGSISFFNPAKIDPILNIDLETKARGVDVILTVSGPIDKLNVNYRSDPPLQFSDIVALLATGRAPSDATLSSHDTGQSQNFQQLGASALIGQAIANPVAGRLQRFFGVSRLKIDPSLTGVTGSPEARLTIEQQVTPEILFTYITDVSSTSTQLIRVEWSFNRHWSAILIREENGYVGLDFAYKKRFK